MTKKSKAESDREAVLLALDQLSQTMDVMRQVVGRLKRSVEQAETAQALEMQRALNPDRTNGRAPRASEKSGDTNKDDQADAAPVATNDTPIVLH